ncbi:MAG: acyl-CoA thioesterase [Bacteroidetes bacterium]|nr:acyl-CoA thioesterase [Bacteroidota bacterium]MBU1115857.1 acyl-CoA thioesterase [Bacteroidota bacterium]MBU1797971.1 acyl-CoA thioesterase [Bacteroidota bacterium]
MFRTERIVEFGMCDIGGILFFAKIFDLTHSAYEEFVLSSNLEENYFENKHFAIPLVTVTADFLKPITLHEVLEIGITASKIGNTSFQLTTTFYDEAGEPKAIVKTNHVFVDKIDFKKIDIPNEFKNLLNLNKE